jgi:hypothetical protein
MIATRPDKPICLPPAPLNGGPLDESTPPKVGQWIWQPKVDDRRVVIHTPSRTIWNQYGQLSVAQDSEKFEKALDKLALMSFAAEWLDAGLMEYRHDMMRGTIVVFDLIGDGTHEERRLTLELLLGNGLWWATECVGQPLANDQVWLIPQFGHELGKTLYAACAEQNAKLGRKFYEGVVAKRLGSHYPQRCQHAKTKCADWIKHRFDQ